MYLGLLAAWIQALSSGSQPALPDPFTLSRSDREEWVRRLENVGQGSDGRLLYEQAFEAYLSPDAPHVQPYFEDAARWIIVNRDSIAAHVDWPDEYAPKIRTWIRMNDAALRLTRSAADCPRALPLSHAENQASGRDWKTIYPSMCDEMSELLAASAMLHARERRWADAYADATRPYRIAAHARQRLFRATADEAFERIAFNALVLLLDRHLPDDVDQLRRVVRDAWSMAAPTEEARWFLDCVYAADFSGQMYDWAENPEMHAEYARYVPSMLTPPRDRYGSTRVFNRPDELRAALLRSSREQSYRAILAVNACCQAWRSRPPGVLATNFSWAVDEARQVANRDVYTLVFSSSLDADLRPILHDAIRDTRRKGLLTILAIYEWRKAHGAWPDRLDRLIPTTDTIDPFSERPFVYRVGPDGASFVLYSVGTDTVDDGGRPPPPRFASIHAVDGVEADKGDLLLWPPEVASFREPR